MTSIYSSYNIAAALPRTFDAHDISRLLHLDTLFNGSGRSFDTDVNLQRACSVVSGWRRRPAR
jgi:hypothetical protein